MTFKLDDFNPLDKVQVHRKTRYIFSKDVLKYAMSVNKIQSIVKRLENKIKLLKITELENNVIERGLGPLTPSPAQGLLKEKIKKLRH